MRLLCGSINARERPWASKRQPIDYKRCCTDRLNAHPERRHSLALQYLSQWAMCGRLQAGKENLHVAGLVLQCSGRSPGGSMITTRATLTQGLEWSRPGSSFVLRLGGRVAGQMGGHHRGCFLRLGDNACQKLQSANLFHLRILLSGWDSYIYCVLLRCFCQF